MKDNNKSQSDNKINAIFNVFKSKPNQNFNYKQVSRIVGAETDEERRQVLEILKELTRQKTLRRATQGKFRLNVQQQQRRRIKRVITGCVDMTANGYAFIVSDEAEKDVFVSQHNLNHALHNDIVKVNIYNTKKTNRCEGEVIEIIERSKQNFVGKIEIFGKNGFLVPDSRQMPYDIFIPADKLNNAKNGQKVIGRITEWAKNMRSPIGEIIDVIGNPGENDTEMHAILAEYDLPYRFPAKLDEIAERITEAITDADYAERRDFRGITTFTIDPDDAKDFDDALSLRIMNGGKYEIGIHIADVTHYVLPDTPIDKEAAERATSIYLVDRTIPMLPERLSNFICSLRPNEEKLCFSAVFQMDEKANITSEWFGRTVIYSNRRFTYDEAQQIIEKKQGDLCNEILILDKLAKILRAKRFKAGAMNFERAEPKFVLDEKGKPVSLYFKESKDSNNLIEEFMLLANRKVAEYIGKSQNNKKPKTFVYRVHDTPDETKFNKLKEFIKRFGYKLKPASEKDISHELNKLMTAVKNKPEANLVETLALRSMAKATYSIENIGHYGLAFLFYTHFTSPIRRYPDMMVHRLLAQYLANAKSAEKHYYQEMCKHSSMMEQRATDAERASIKYKMVEFMQDKIGCRYEGIITGVTEWGIYVEICENKIEGMVAIRGMNDDYYYFDEENYCVTGRIHNKKYTLGDKVCIKVVRSDLERKQIDFIMIPEEQI
ncbi:MAG: ribonuclease R [Prevotellaceae bacterium]|jgi:ribonuclease R|nr:ribonuclease R [Prevotellaceae bacterium]